MTYKMSIEISMQHVVGGVMLYQLCTQIALYSTRRSFIQHLKLLESILMQSLEFLRNKTYNKNADN